MIRYQRPAVPASFKPPPGRRSKRGPFPEAWRAFKATFSVAQHGKCGYCESFIAGTQDGDVEHYAPKALVHALDASAPGTEAEPGRARLATQSRKTSAVSATGYWWRAYDWTNYLFACTVCNTKYKGNVFPLAPAPPAKWAPRKRDAAHVPLLLNCFDDHAPWRHFEVSIVDGEVIGATERGTATVGTCGLHRDTLRLPRRQAVQDTERFYRMATDPGGSDASRALGWREVVERGGDDRPFAGAVRAVAERMFKMAWDDIVAIASGLR